MKSERITNKQALSNHGHKSGRRMMLDILEAGLRAADPYYAMHQAMRREERDGRDVLYLGGALFEPEGSPRTGEEVIDLNEVGRIYVFGAGKGIQRAAKAVEQLLGDRLTGGCVIDKHGTDPILERVEVVFGAHPVPDAGCVEGCERILELAADLRPDDLCITLMGNGVGSLLTLPAAGVSLEDIRRTVYLFQIERGGPTLDLIPIRNHLDRMKGGKFSKHLQPARCVHMLAFLRAPYARIMTSPYYRWLHCLPDETTPADAVRMLHKWDCWDEAPQSVRDYLTDAVAAREATSDAVADTVADSVLDPAADTLKIAEFEAMRQRVLCLFPPELGMIPTAKQYVEGLGLRAYVLYNNTIVKPEAAQAGSLVAHLALHSETTGEPFVPPCVLLNGGEMVVTVGKETGMGGRNQEYAVAAAMEIAGNPNLIVASLDSDGTDGPGHQFVEGYDEIPVLAGGLVDGTTAPRAEAGGLDLHDALKRHDTSPALWQLGDGIVTTYGMSMTDLTVTLILKPEDDAPEDGDAGYGDAGYGKTGYGKARARG
ncbi:MAG: DUF4147 domain-containing protein [Litorilinea sp.]